MKMGIYRHLLEEELCFTSSRHRDQNIFGLPRNVVLGVPGTALIPCEAFLVMNKSCTNSVLPKNTWYCVMW